MSHFSKIIKADEEQCAKRTLFIRRIPKTKRIKETLVNYFTALFSDTIVEGVQFVYDTRSLTDLHANYSNMVNAKCFCEEYSSEYQESCQVRPYFLGQFGGLLCCCNCCPKVDGSQHYALREQELEKEIEREFKKTISNPTGSVFITFQTEKMAQE